MRLIFYFYFHKSVQQGVSLVSCSGIEARPPHLNDVTTCLTKSQLCALQPPTLQHTTQVIHNRKPLLKVWWHAATLFDLFLHLSSSHTIFIYTTRRDPLLLSSLHPLGREPPPGVPSRDSNSGLPYSKPMRYNLSHTAPKPLLMCRSQNFLLTRALLNLLRKGLGGSKPATLPH